MNKRQNIIDSIMEQIGSGKVNIIFTPKGVDSESFLMDDVKSFLEKYFDNCVMAYTSAFSQDYDLKLFNSFVSTNRKVFILINDLSKYKNPLSIIEMFYGNKNVDVIATTSVTIKRLARYNETDIRGRYVSYFYPPFLYGDKNEDDKNNSIQKLFELYFYDYKYRKIGEQIYLYLLKHVGQLLSFRDVYSKCGGDVSLVTFIDIVNYLHDSGLYYILTRIQLDTLESMEYGYAFYPSRAQDIMSKELELDDAFRLKAYFDSMIVAKSFYDNCEIYRAFHSKRETVKEKRVVVYLNDSFLVKNGNQQVLLKTYYSEDNSRSLDLFLNYKGNIQKVLAVYNEKNTSLDSAGIVRCGIKQILEKGVFSYGDF